MGWGGVRQAAEGAVSASVCAQGLNVMSSGWKVSVAGVSGSVASVCAQVMNPVSNGGIDEQGEPIAANARCRV